MLTIVIPMIAVVAIFLAEIAFIRQAKSYMPNQGIAVPKPAKIPPEKQKASESEPIIWRRFKPYNPMDASGHTRLSDYLLSIMSASEVKRLLDVLQGRTEKKAIVITGRQGPTGKTTLAEVLKKSGYPVFEAYQVHEIRLDKPIAKPVPINPDDIISDVVEFWSKPNNSNIDSFFSE